MHAPPRETDLRPRREHGRVDAGWEWAVRKTALSPRIRTARRAVSDSASENSQSELMDVCIVSGRRPDLLAETLQSFGERLFSHFEIKSVYVNIDPIFGNEDDHEQCEVAIRSFFPGVRIFSPTLASNCAAVARLWAATTAPVVFCMEDDWIVNEPVESTILAPFQDPSVAQVSFETPGNKRGDYGALQVRESWIRIFGRRLPLKTRVPLFTMSPSFVRGSFARQAARLMDVSLDPDRQFSYGMNVDLEAFARPFNNYIHRGSNGFVVSDTGLKWREERGIAKEVRNGQSYWLETAEPTGVESAGPSSPDASANPTA